MHWLRNTKIRAKMLLSFSAVVLLGAILGVIGLISTQMLTNSAKELESFQHDSSTFSSILNAHFSWRNNLTETVMTGKEFKGSLDPTTCALGSWMSSEDASKITDAEILSLLNQIKSPHDAIHHNAAPVLAKVEAGDLAGAQAEFIENVAPQLQLVIDGLTKMGLRYDVLTEEKVIGMETLGATITIIIVITIVIAVLLAITIAMIMAKSISEPLVPLSVFMNNAGTTGNIEISPSDGKIIGKYSKKTDEMGKTVAGAASFVMYISKIAEHLENVAGGDLSAKLEALSERDVMGKALVHTLDNLNRLFSEINSSTVQVSIGAKHIADASQTLAKGSTEQAATVQQLAASTGEIAEKTKANSEMAGSAAEMAETIRQNAEKGARQMGEMMSAVNEINQASQSIGRVIKVIDDIAFQTNILALNAAVEAARAGQHGKGFAVVSDEVRNLAAKSAAAAKDTSDLIQNSIEKSELGSRIANDTSASLEEIVAGINESAQLIRKIAESSEGQTAEIMQINTGIDHVATVVQQNSATAQECAAASEEMSGQSQLLEQLVAQFKLRENSGKKAAATAYAAEDTGMTLAASGSKY